MNLKTFGVLLTIALVGIIGTLIAVFITTGNWSIDQISPDWATKTIMGIIMSFIITVTAIVIWNHEKSLKPSATRSPS